MLGRTLARVDMAPESGLAVTLKFLGEPLNALGLAVLAAVICLGWSIGMARDQVGGVLRKSLASIAVALRQATGSATLATTTTAGILAPLIIGLEGVQDSLVALAIGAGSVIFCHVNDAGFWREREYFGLQLKQTLMVWSVLQTIVSLVGLLGALLLWNLLV